MKYSWKPDVPDQRDYTFTKLLTALPALIDLRKGELPVFDQKNLGSCTGNAWAGLYAFDMQKQGESVFIPSRLFIYYNERVIEGTVNEDAGAMIRTGAKVLAKIGVCSEKHWAYVPIKYKIKPTTTCYEEAAKFKALTYSRVPRTLHAMKSCLAGGYPFVVGFSVYESFESEQVAKTGIMPLPSPTEALLGGHAVVVVGYDDAHQHFIVRNSWGSKWGDKGHFYMPYHYLLDSNLSDDFWTIQKVS